MLKALGQWRDWDYGCEEKYREFGHEEKISTFCQRAPKVCHLRAVQSVPPLIDELVRFSGTFLGESPHVKQVKDGRKRTALQPLQRRLV